MSVRAAMAVLLTTLLIATGCAKSSKPADERPVRGPLPPPPKGSATVEEVLDSGVDLWGEAALKQPGDLCERISRHPVSRYAVSFFLGELVITHVCNLLLAG